MKRFHIVIFSIIATFMLSGCNVSITPVEEEKNTKKPDLAAEEILNNKTAEGNESIISPDELESNKSESNETTLLMPPELLNSTRPRVVPKEMPSMPPELLNNPRPKVVKEQAPSMPPELLNRPVPKVVKEDIPSAPPGVTIPEIKEDTTSLAPPPFLDQEPTKAK